MVESLGAQRSGGRGPQICKPPGLGVDSLFPGREGVRTAAADVDVDVEAVLDHLRVWLHSEPDAGAAADRINDAVHAHSQIAFGKSDVASPVVPGWETIRGRFKHIAQGGRPEAGKWLGMLAVNDQLEPGKHGSPSKRWPGPTQFSHS